MRLVRTADECRLCDAVVFHYDDRLIVDGYGGKKIQVVTDRPPVEGIDAYVCCNEYVINPKISSELTKHYSFKELQFNFVDDRWFHVHYPPTYGASKCKPVFPPENFKFVGREHTLQSDILYQDNINRIEAMGINLRFDFTGDANTGDEHVYFCLRDNNHKSEITGYYNGCGVNGNKTPNRLYQAWYMSTPGIFNTSPEMYHLWRDEYDYSKANNITEFTTACKRLVTDEEFYWNSVERCEARCNETNPYTNPASIIDQWIVVLDFLSISYK